MRNHHVSVRSFEEKILTLRVVFLHAMNYGVSINYSHQCMRLLLCSLFWLVCVYFKIKWIFYSLCVHDPPVDILTLLTPSLTLFWLHQFGGLTLMVAAHTKCAFAKL